jgi:hypothetical protein
MRKIHFSLRIESEYLEMEWLLQRENNGQKEEKS